MRQLQQRCEEERGARDALARQLDEAVRLKEEMSEAVVKALHEERQRTHSLATALDALRTLPMGWTERTDWPPVALTGGLYQGKRIGRSAEAVYRRALRSVFLSRVVLRLEERLRTGWARPDELVLTLRAYRMIGGREPMDRAYLAEWLAGDWQRTLPGSENEGRRRALGDHLAALFEVGFAAIPVDDLLVDRVRQVIEQAPARRPS